MARRGDDKTADPGLSDDVNALIFDYITHDAINAVLAECRAYLAKPSHASSILAESEARTQQQLDLVDSFLRLVDDDSAVQRVPIFRLRLLYISTLFSAYLSRSWRHRLRTTSLIDSRVRNQERAIRWWNYRRSQYPEACARDLRAIHVTPSAQLQLDTPALLSGKTDGPCLLDLITPFVSVTHARARLAEPYESDEAPPSSQVSGTEGSSPWSANPQWLHLAADLMLFASLESDLLGQDQGDSNAEPASSARYAAFAWGALPALHEAEQIAWDPNVLAKDTPKEATTLDAIPSDEELDTYRVFTLNTDEPGSTSALWCSVREEAILRLDPAHTPHPYPIAESDSGERSQHAGDRDAARQEGLELLLQNLLSFLLSLHESLPIPILVQIEDYRDRKARQDQDAMNVDGEELRTIELDVGMWLTEDECDTLISIVKNWRR